MPLAMQRLEDRLAFAAAPTVISTVTDDAGPVHHAIGINGITDDTTPTLSGKAQAKSTVTVYDWETKLGTATADAKGVWKFTPSALKPDLHSFKASAAVGKGPAVVSGNYMITIDNIAPAGKVTATPAVLTYGVGKKLSFTVTFNETVNVHHPLGDIHAVPALPITIGGHARRAAYESGSGSNKLVFSYTVAAGDNGDLLLGSDMTVPAAAWIRDAAGNNAALKFLEAPAPPNIRVDGVGPKATFDLPEFRNTKVDSVDVKFDEDVSGVKVAAFKLTHDGAPVAIGTATCEGENGDVDSVFTLSGLGAFTAKAGVYTLVLEASAVTDVGGNHMAHAASVTWHNDLTPPAPPVIASATDDEGPLKGTVHANGLTDDFTPTLHGTAEANSTVNVFENTVLKGTAKADAHGAWTFTLPDVSNGSHTYTAKAIDRVGNKGELSHGFALKVDAERATPSVTGVPQAKAYKGGDKLEFTVTFSEPVKVEGHPVLSLNGGNLSYAIYQSGSGTNKLHFRADLFGHPSVDKLVIGDSILLNHGTIRNLAGKNAELKFSSIASTAGIVIDSMGPEATFQAIGTTTTAVSSVWVSFDEAVKVKDPNGSLRDLSIKDFTLRLATKELPLSTATLTKDGNKYTVFGLGGLTAAKGNYDLYVGLKTGGLYDLYGNHSPSSWIAWKKN